MPSMLATQASWKSPWFVVLIGFAALYLPVYWWAASGIWQTDDQAHGALILMIIAWLFWEKRKTILAVEPEPAVVTGWACMILGLMIYFLGRMSGISILTLGSQQPVLTGVFLVLLGWPGIRAAWFPLFYILFMVPLPGIIVDAATGPLKQWISCLAENALYAAGYPIARNGVVLTIGQYQMLVADACSGLHSMFSLSALGLLFLYIKQRSSIAHNSIMVACILPIAFAANLVRVLVLVLITYHLGDEAGQGFLHGTAGIVLMVAALGFLLLLDAVLARLIKPKSLVRCID